ncbi:unnamed protein product, partial [Brenthis ino]
MKLSLLLSGQTKRDLEAFVDELNARPQCPVGLNTLLIPIICPLGLEPALRLPQLWACSSKLIRMLGTEASMWEYVPTDPSRGVIAHRRPDKLSLYESVGIFTSDNIHINRKLA